MSKYDFGYELEQGSTNKWAFEMVEKNCCRVLELGPAIGNLTFHLTNEKMCQVDIVEINEEDGKRTAEFAKNAQIGPINGNLNSDVWYDNLQNEKYDYIIALDVLEHLENPEHVLILLKKLLQKDGKILLSIPNLAHNAVILELLNNDFRYHDLGLLDQTHVHFFAYKSIIKMIKNAELYISYINAIKKGVTDTEIQVDFENVPPEVEQYLKMRKYADAYQYLFILGKEQSEIMDYLNDGIIQEDMCETKILVDGMIKNELVFRNHYENVSIEIDMAAYKNANSIRLVPIEKKALIYDLQVYEIDENEKEIELNYNWTTGIQIDNSCVILTDEGREINYLISTSTKKIKVLFKCMLQSELLVQKALKLNKIKNELLDIINEKNLEKTRLEEEIQNKKENEERICIKVNELQYENHQLQMEKGRMADEIQDINQQLQDKLEKLFDKEQKNNELEKELTTIKSNILYRIYMKIYKGLHRKGI